MPYTHRTLLIIALLALSRPALAEPDLDVTMDVVESDAEQGSVTHAIELPRQGTEEQRSEREQARKERDDARQEARDEAQREAGQDRSQRPEPRPEPRREPQGEPKGERGQP